MFSSSRAHRWTSVLALAACLCAQLAGAVHSASVRHVACAEHGGVVELHADAGAPDSVLATTTVLRAAPDELHHAHCELCATVAAVHAHRTPAVRGDVLALRLTLVPSRAPRFVRALFRLAPKGSPPISSAV